MSSNFSNYIPTIYYYNFDNETYINDSFDPNTNTLEKLIQKPNKACGGKDIKIIYNIEKKSETIISKYIKHDEYFVGHFLVSNGIIFIMMMYQ